MDFSLICRTCLSGDSLNPIFTKANDNETYSNAIYIATGVQVLYNDNLPQNMCTACINKLNDILKFRKQCKDVESRLLHIISKDEPPLITENNCWQDIPDTTKRKRTHSNDNIDNVKAEFDNGEIKNETDIEDDKPLKSLLDSQISTINILKIQENDEHSFKNGIKQNDYESKTELSDEDLSDDNDTQEHSIENKTKTQVENISKVLLTDSNDKTINNSNDSVTVPMEAPYELITDPVTQKVTRVFCKLCNKELSIRSIDSHMTRRHPGADERKVKCDLCDSYVMKEKLNRHILLMHGGSNFKCGYCKSEFDSKEELIDHVSSCTAKKRKRKVNESGRELRECDVCHKVMQKASLRMHKAVKHAGLKPVCEHCGKSFGNKFRLNEHYRAKHGYEKFQCSYCDFRSAGVMAMRNHERRHRGEKPFVCEACGAKFHAAYLLAQHKHSHRTEKLVKCDLCPATFKANNSLHMHKLTCHSNSMYRCIVCCRSYKCRHYAVKHVRHVHRYNGPTPPLTVVTNEEAVKNTT